MGEEGAPLQMGEEGVAIADGLLYKPSQQQQGPKVAWEPDKSCRLRFNLLRRICLVPPIPTIYLT